VLAAWISFEGGFRDNSGPKLKIDGRHIYGRMDVEGAVTLAVGTNQGDQGNI
jgi:hypothetical protein